MKTLPDENRVKKVHVRRDFRSVCSLKSSLATVAKTPKAQP
jgi:hypothetical protein